MANEFANAFDELYAVFAETRGDTPQANFAGTLVDAIWSELTADDTYVHGGTGESGGFNVMVRKSDFVTPPASKSALTVDGRALRIVSVVSTNQATYTVTAIDFKARP